MADKLFALEGPKELKAITVNGAVIVESEEERQRLALISINLIITPALFKKERGKS